MQEGPRFADSRNQDSINFRKSLNLMTLSVDSLKSLDRIRDGGSLSALFADDSGVHHELRFPIHLLDIPSGELERAGYKPPILTTFYPSEYRSPVTGEVQVTHAPQSVAATWEQAQHILDRLDSMVEPGAVDQRVLFDLMRRIVLSEGRAIV